MKKDVEAKSNPRREIRNITAKPWSVNLANRLTLEEIEEKKDVHSYSALAWPARVSTRELILGGMRKRKRGRNSWPNVYRDDLLEFQASLHARK